MGTAVQSVLNCRELLRYIEFLRKQMINMGLTYGFQDNRTIQASQELDYFIYEYQRITA
ncbi:Spo0E family sporulation regulatory protein-aspartic acid phosphatase [Mesobacillus maritimus]|uniref:Spo0E family sporulation regulatory protein-aspartic acid phosphatase n=1 Tax=Mesobacillus maritimus TaxID=1643336 RepID=UPI00384ECBFB